MAKTPEDVPAIKTTTQITPGEPKLPPQTERPFSSYMKTGEPNPLMTAGKNPQISPFDLAHGKVPAAGPNFVTIQEQAKTAQSTMGDLVNQLKTPKLKLKASTKYLLKNKLTSAYGHIRSAGNKVGAEQAEEEVAPAGSGPLAKFLAIVTNGQNQMQATQDQLAALAAKGDQLNPSDLLLIQVKLNKAQQELEFSSMLLGKAMDDLKQMMNIQL